MEATQQRSEIEALDMGILTVEDEDGHYQPVACVATIREAREMAADYQTWACADYGSVVPDRFVVWELSGTGYRMVAVAGWPE